MTSIDLDAQEIKRRLPYTWVPFFSRFGALTEVQVRTVPVILAGKNVVVISPAASGKTEAVVAPLLENIIARWKSGSPTEGIQLLYISPTRALVNDLFRRLEQPVQYTGLTVSRKTGDRPTLDFKRLPSVLLTTPESFDSLLTRHPKIFKTLRVVVLDELHLIDNTPRGDQVRILLERLRRIQSSLQYAALSATIDDVNIGTRYFKDAEVCVSELHREIECRMVEKDEFVHSLFSIARERKFKKILVFFNARSLAELFSRDLNRPPFQDAVLVHHASLQKQRREEVERQMNTAERAILCATSTLELGIDIGDVDCTVLYRPPFNISSFLQRIGRGNRRMNTAYALCVYTDEWERIVFETFYDCARRGMLYDNRYQPSLSVLPQQIYSYLYQRRRIGSTVKNLDNILVPAYTADQVKTVFRELRRDGKIAETRPGIYFLSAKLEDKIRWGKIHSNIAEISFGEYDVINAGNGMQVGRIFYLKHRFVLGGHCWETVRIDEQNKNVYAKYIGDVPAVVKIFEGKGAGNYNFRLAPVLKDRLFPDMTKTDFPYARESADICILHLLGSLYAFLISEALQVEGINAVDVQGKILVLNRYEMVDDRFPLPAKESIRRVIADNIAKLEDALGSGAYIYDLPAKYQVEDHYLNLDIDGFYDYLESLKLVEVQLEDFRSAINRLTRKKTEDREDTAGA